MKGIFQRFCGVCSAGLLVVSLPLAIDLGFRWHMEKEEEALEELKIDTLEIKGATLEDALWEITRKVHTLGHPEVDFTVYRDGHRISGFHGLLEGEPDLKPKEKLDLLMIPHPSYPRGSKFIRPYLTNDYRPSTLGALLAVVGGYFDRPCVLRGHSIISAHTPGSTEPFRRVNIHYPAWEYTLKDFSAVGIKAWMNENGFRYYEGMSVTYMPGGQLNFYAPRSTIEDFEISVNAEANLERPTRWDRWKQKLISWLDELRKRTF